MLTQSCCSMGERDRERRDRDGIQMLILQLSPDVCSSVTFRSFIETYFLQHNGSPVILLFPILNISEKFRQGHPPIGTLNTCMLYRFHDFPPALVVFFLPSVSAPLKPRPQVLYKSSRDKLYPVKFILAAAATTFFLPREPPEDLLLLICVCVLLTRALLAIAKFLALCCYRFVSSVSTTS